MNYLVVQALLVTSATAPGEVTKGETFASNKKNRAEQNAEGVKNETINVSDPLPAALVLLPCTSQGIIWAFRGTQPTHQAALGRSYIFHLQLYEGFWLQWQQ